MAEMVRTREEWTGLAEDRCRAVEKSVKDLHRHLEVIVTLPARIEHQRKIVDHAAGGNPKNSEDEQQLKRLQKEEAEEASRSSFLRSAVERALASLRALASEVDAAIEKGEVAQSKLGRRLKGEEYRWELQSAREAWDGERRFFLDLRWRLQSAHAVAGEGVDVAERRYAREAAISRSFARHGSGSPGERSLGPTPAALAGGTSSGHDRGAGGEERGTGQPVGAVPVSFPGLRQGSPPRSGQPGGPGKRW